MKNLVGAVGLEPMTSCMSSMRSNQLSYVPVQLPKYNTIFRVVLSIKNSAFFHLNCVISHLIFLVTLFGLPKVEERPASRQTVLLKQMRKNMGSEYDRFPESDRERNKPRSDLSI